MTVIIGETLRIYNRKGSQSEPVWTFRYHAVSLIRNGQCQCIGPDILPENIKEEHENEFTGGEIRENMARLTISFR